MNILEHNGYHGSVEVDLERGVLRGKILFIADLVTYEAGTPAQLKKEFEAAIEDYLETCEALGRKPLQPASGTFNVRTGPELHRDAQVRALADGVPMNEVVIRALGCYLHGRREVREKHVETTIEKRYMTFSKNETGTIVMPFGETKKTEVRNAVLTA